MHSKSESLKKRDQRACCLMQLFLFVESFAPAISLYIYKNKHHEIIIIIIIMMIERIR